MNQTFVFCPDVVVVIIVIITILPKCLLGTCCKMKQNTAPGDVCGGGEGGGEEWGLGVVRCHRPPQRKTCSVASNRFGDKHDERKMPFHGECAVVVLS